MEQLQLRSLVKTSVEIKISPSLHRDWSQGFNNAFQGEGNDSMKLMKDFISIYLQNMEVVIMVCKTKLDNVIGVVLGSKQF